MRWTYLATVVNGLSQLAILAILSRLLEPRDFGLMAAALIFIKSAQLFCQSGVERAVIWSKSLSPQTTATLFWVSNAVGIALTIAGVAASTVASPLIGSDVARVLGAVSPIFLIWSPALVSRGLLRRDLNFAPLAAADVASYLLGYAPTAIVLAKAGCGPMAIVGATYAQGLIQSVIVFFAHRPALMPIGFDAENKALIRFQFRASGLSAFEFLDWQVVTAATGYLFGLNNLGQFTRAWSLIQLPIEQVGNSITRVIYTSFVTVSDDRERLRRGALQVLGASALIFAPIAFGVAGASKEIVRVVLGPGWTSAESIMLYLAPAVFCGMLGHVMAVLAETDARFSDKAIIQFFTTMTFVAAIFLSTSMGAAGIAVALSVSRIIYLSLYVQNTARRLDSHVREVLRCMVPGLTAGSASFGTSYLLSASLKDVPPQIVLPVQILSCGLVVSFCCLIIFRRTTETILSEIGVLAALRRTALGRKSLNVIGFSTSNKS